MEAISLNEFYERVKSNDYGEQIYVEKADSSGNSFEILEVLGQGSASYVFLAGIDKDKFVALRMSYENVIFKKKLDTVKKKMGEDFKKYILDLLEPSISLTSVLIGDKKKFDKKIFMSVWEKAETTLKYKLDESFNVKLKWFIQFLKGLKAIQSSGRIHFDLKLENLFLVDNQLKIGDFEFYFKKEEFFEKCLRICGTHGHIAPELFYGPENASHKCDIFSAGVAFCELFTGSEPPRDLFKENSDLSIEEEEELNKLFGNKHLEIRNKEIFDHFINNFRFFNFFKNELEKKLNKKNIPGKQRKIYELIQDMINIDPKTRPDVDRLLFKIHEVEFDPGFLTGKQLMKRYNIQELIDACGRGIIYRVWDPFEEEVKAIKLFPPKYNFIKYGFDEIRNELQLANSISHRNIVRCYGLEMEKDLNFILMEYIRGFNLKKKLNSSRGKKLKELEALKIMRQVASGLIEAHRNKVIHRNLKDTNIMITADDNIVKIINFGLSLKIKKSISETTGEAPMGDKSLVLTPPEHLKEMPKEQNEQTDVWGFGIILYQLLTGKIPDEKALKKIEENHFPIAGISGKTKAVIMKCLEKDRRRRYRNMVEVYDDLYGEPGPEPPGEIKGEPGFFQKFKKKWVLGLIFGLIAAALLVILGTNIISTGKGYKMLYSGNPGDAETPGGGIGYAISTDGIKWKRYKENPVIPHGQIGSFNEFESSQPFVVHDGINYHMLFSGRNNREKGLEYQIGYSRAEGVDQWKLSGIEPVTLDNGKIKIPGPILYIDGYYKMWYPGNGDVYYACTTAKDQSIKDITVYSDNPVLSRGKDGEWDKDIVITWTVLYELGMYRMWYTGKSGEESKIGYATSGDGITWYKYPKNPVFDDKNVTLEMNPCVIHDSQGYKMYYTAATAGSEYYPIRLATSTDGIKWEKYSNTPVFDTGKENWEKSKISVTFVTMDKK